MFRLFVALFLLTAGMAAAQEGPLKIPKSVEDKHTPPPRSDSEPTGESSSKEPRAELGEPASGLPAGAASDVAEFRNYNPHKANKSVEVGDYYFKRKNYKAARSRYAEAVELDPDNHEATFKLAQTQELMQELPAALLHYQEYLRLQPEGPFAREARAAAEKIAATVQAQDPGYLDRERAAKRLEMANGWFAQKNYVNAADLYREALKLRPNLPEATFGLAQSTGYLGNFAEAIQWYGRYLELEPNGPHAAQARKEIARLKPHAGVK